MEKIKVGITGQAGFIGTHLFNYLSLFKDVYELVPFGDNYFDDEAVLTEFALKCDVIVHLAAVNRHHDPNELYSKNIELVDKLIKSLSLAKSKAHIIFSSSIQEERDNIYGKSKKEGRLKLLDWATQNKSGFTGLIIPNVFGPFGKPFYNSVISTFSYQLINNDTPKIENDVKLNLLYVGELCEIISDLAISPKGQITEENRVPHSFSINVSAILEELKKYNENYLNYGIIPKLQNNFEINLFNTFRSYINCSNQFPFKYKVNEDERGIFVETMKLNTGGQVSYSTTNPGVTRGNHFHTRKIERFSVIKGKARIQLRRYGTKEIIDLFLDGTEPSFVDMPIWYTHNITNIGNDELVTLFWINEFYNQHNADTFFETV
jgi:Nucleoside-diphosphate-sugar epimerases